MDSSNLNRKPHQAEKQLRDEIEERLGVLPSVFASVHDISTLEYFWNQTLFCYLDNPLPSLFKEKLFAYLSRFCVVPYCMARHTAFLVGRGHVAGDPSCEPLSLDEVLAELMMPIPGSVEIEQSLANLRSAASNMQGWEDTAISRSVVVCAVAMFLRERLDGTYLGEIRLELSRVLGPSAYNHLMHLLSFVRVMHFWTENQNHIFLEHDVEQLVEENKALRDWLHDYTGIVQAELQASAAERIHTANELRATVEQEYNELYEGHRKLQRVEQTLREILEAAPDAIIVTGPRGEITRLNAETERLFGYSRDELQGQSIEVLVPARHRLHHADLHEEYRSAPVSREMGAGKELFALRKDDSEFPAEISLSPYESDEGLSVVVVVRDITERKKLEQHQRLLMNELDHRVKNTLSVVLSIAQQTLRRAVDLEGFKESFIGRLKALAEVHRLLTDRNWREVPLSDVVRFSTKPHDESDGARVRRSGDDILLPIKVAQSLYLVLHELATNSVKYGSLSSGEGWVDVRWTLSENADGKNLNLVWSESNGPQVSTERTEGFGTRLVDRVISYELRGNVQFDYHTDGLRVEISLPLPAELPKQAD